MLAYYEKITNLLKHCATYKVNQAEEQLKKLAMQDLQVLACLQHCLKDVTLDNGLKTIATSNINSLFLHNISEYTQQFCLKYFQQFLNDPSIPIKNKKQISRALMHCIEQCDIEHLTMWKKYTYQVILHPNTYEIGLILLTAFCCSEIKYNIIQDLDERIFPFTMQILCKKLQNFNQENSIKILEIYQIWKVIGEYLLHQCPQTVTKVFSKWAKNQNFILSLEFVYKELSTGKGAHFLYLNEQILYQQIVQIKRMALQLHLLILDHLLNKYKKVHQTNLYQFTGLQIQIFVNTVCFVNYCQNFSQKYDHDQILIYMIKIIYAMFNQSPMILSRSWKSMLHYLVFPLLSISEQQRADFEENTNNFVQLSQDCCQRQKMGLLKTQAAKFLQKISDSSQLIQKQIFQIQGIQASQIQKKNLKKDEAFVTKYIINFAIASIKHNLQMQFIDKNQFFQTTQNQIPESVKILSVQSAFLVLSIFSYCLDYYKKQLESIRVILCSDRSANLPPIERTRIYVFLAYNYQEVFGLIHIKSLKFWLNLALNEQNHPTVGYCALDFVTNSLNKFYDQNQINCIISKIQMSKSPNFWAMIKKLVMQHVFKFSQNLLISLVKESLRRIQIQIVQIQSQKIKYTYIITVLLQVLKIISEKGEFIQQKYQLRKMLWSTSKLYQISTTNYFEKEVVSIINCFLYYATKQQIQYPQMSQFIPDFIQDFIKSDYSPTYYYIAFNNYIMKGSYQIIVRPILIALNQSLNFFLGPISSQTNRKKIPIAHTLLLLQNILAQHGPNIPLQQLKFIRQMLKSLYPKKIQIRKGHQSKTKLSIYDRTLLSRALNLQLLCHMFDKHEPTISTIQKYLHLKIFYGYDASVILTCLQILIRRELKIDKLVELLEFTITVIYLFMEIQIEAKIQKINQQQQKQKKRLEYDNDSDGYKIDQEQDEDDKNKKSAMLIRIKKVSDYESILSFIDTPFLKNEKKYICYSRGIKSLQDVRFEFVHMLMDLRNSNPALIQSILNGFSQEMIHRLQVITQNKRGDIIQGNLSIAALEVKPQRKKYRVKKIKQGTIEDTQNIQDYQFSEQEVKRRHLKDSMDDPEDQEQKQMIKRKRAQKKRKQKQNKL